MSTLSKFFMIVCIFSISLLSSQQLHSIIDQNAYEDLFKVVSYKKWIINEKNELGWTPLYHCIIDKKLDLAKILIKNGADLDAFNGRGYQFTALYSASEKGMLAIVQLLIESGAAINKGDSYGTSPLCISISENHPHVAEYLIKMGADCRELNKKNGKTPIHIATQQKQYTVIELLLEGGADINCFTTQSNFCATPLQLAVMEGEYNIVKLLLDNGADVNAYCGKGMSALDEAKYRNQNSLIQLLMSRGAKSSKELHQRSF